MKLEKVMRKSFYVNAFLVVIKILSGVIFGSFSLIADGIHSISDLLSDVFVILGIKQAVKPADDEHPFGHGKFEYVLSLFLGLSILIIAVNLGRTVINNFNETSAIPSSLSLIVIVFVVVIKYILATYLIREGEIMNSQIIKASGKESLTDVFSSLVVFFGILSVIAGEYFDIDFLLYGDKIGSIFISLLIVKIALEIIIEAIASIQGKAVDKEVCIVYKDLIKTVDGVIDVDNIDMITYGPYYQALVDIRVDGNITVTKGHDIALEVTKLLMQDEKVCHVIVHVNPEE
ncbi:MAG: cation diffusion facilitator family transporter [Candidatus Izemoplasma sp.]